MTEVDKKHLKYRILVSFRSFKFYSIFNLRACDVYVFIIIMKNAWVRKNSTNILGREYGWSERMLSQKTCRLHRMPPVVLLAIY